MKRFNIIATLLLGFLSFTFVSCSEIAEDERLVLVDKIDPTNPDNPDNPDGKPTKFPRRVLVEDFTGQKCPNCPDGAAIIEECKKLYPDQVISVALHCGNFSEGTPLRSDVAEQICSKYSVNTFPSANVNRTGVLTNMNLWTSAIIGEVKKDAYIDFTIDTSFDAATNALEVSVSTYAINSTSGKLNVWVLEDGIVSLQYKLNNERDPNYVHNHILRAAITPVDGKDINVGAEQTVTEKFTTTLNPAWKPSTNPENMSVLVFVDNETGVLQAAINKIKISE